MRVLHIVLAMSLLCASLQQKVWAMSEQSVSVDSNAVSNEIQLLERDERIAPPESNGVEITSQPKSITAAAGEVVTVSVKATGEGLTYKWYYKNKEAWKSL